MKKFLGYSVVIILVLGIGLYITMQFFLGGIVKKSVNKFGPGITQTKVELQGANISPLSGVGTLTGLSVGNPAGWSQTDARYEALLTISHNATLKAGKYWGNAGQQYLTGHRLSTSTHFVQNGPSHDGFAFPSRGQGALEPQK